MFWDSIENVGNFDECRNFQLKSKIRPATLIEVCNEGLCEYVDSIKEYTLDNGKIVEIKYMNLN